MLWDQNLSNLRNVLSGLYWNVEEARRVVLEVGMNTAFVRFSGRSINTWQSILEEAQHHEKVQEIIAKAREEYPKVQSLALAEQQLLLTVITPEIPTDAWHGPTDAGQLEKIMGAVSTLRPISFLERGLQMARSVARVVLADGSAGSGFLIPGNLLVTNHHVIASEASAQGAVVEFNYQQTMQGTDAPVAAYRLAPEDGFATSPEEEQGGDDWAAVRVRGNPNEQWGALTLTPTTPKAQDEVSSSSIQAEGQSRLRSRTTWSPLPTIGGSNI